MESIVNIDNDTLSTVNMPIPNKPRIIYPCDKNTKSCGCGYNNVEFTSLGMVSGEDAIEHSWSMMVSLRSKQGKHICSGTILSDSFILTAAHCIHKWANDDKIIIAATGIHSLSHYATSMHKIDKVYIHENYSNDSQYLHDIAILHLEYPLELEIQTLLTRTCLPNVKSSSIDSKLVLIGWKDLSNVLQQVSMKILDNKHESCSKLISNHSYQFCATMITSGTGQSNYLIILSKLLTCCCRLFF